MPTDGHNIAQNWLRFNVSEWLRQRKINWEEYRSVEMTFGSTVDLLTPPGTQSFKQPDILLRPKNGQLLPIILVEVGWSESGTDLVRDMELLLQGGNRVIEVVITLNWRLQQHGTVVAGTIQVWGLNANGNPELQQTEVCQKPVIIFQAFESNIFKEVFPIPDPDPQDPGKRQEVKITRREFLGSLCSRLRPKRDPNEEYCLDIDLLREEAMSTFEKCGLRPAE